MEAVVISPSFVSGDSQTGYCNPTDYLSRYIRAVLQLKAYIADDKQMVLSDMLALLSTRAQINLIPVEYLSAVTASAALSADVPRRIAVLSPKGTTYAAIGEACLSREPTLSALHYADFARKVCDSSHEHALAPLQDWFSLDASDVQSPTGGLEHYTPDRACPLVSREALLTQITFLTDREGGKRAL